MRTTLTLLALCSATIGQDKPDGKEFPPLSQGMLSELKDITPSPKSKLRIQVVAPKDRVSLTATSDDQKRFKGEAHLDVLVENIGKDAFPYWVKHLDVAILNEAGEELPVSEEEGIGQAGDPVGIAVEVAAVRALAGVGP